MSRTTRTKAKILGRLTIGPVRASDLKRLTGLNLASVRSAISRLRDEQFTITASDPGDPRYELLSGPGSLGPSYVCPRCSAHIKIGATAIHAPGCALQ